MSFDDSSKLKSPFFPLAVLILVAVVIRIVWLSLVPVIPISDSHAYDTFARNLLTYGTYGWTKDQPSAFWPPGTSFLYVAVYKVFGANLIDIAVLNVGLSATLILSVVRVTIRFYGRDAAVFAGLVLALWPTLIAFTTILASELPYVVLTTLALDAWTTPNRQLMLRGCIAGLFLGAAALVRPIALVLPILFGTSIYLSGSLSREWAFAQLRLSVLSLVVMAAVVAPWTWRNLQLYGKAVPVSTNGGITFWMGNSPGTNGGYMDIPARLGGLNDYEQSRILEKEARQFIIDNPGLFVRRTLYKLFQLYSNESIGIVWNARGIEARFSEASVTLLKRVTQTTWLLILLIAFYGAIVRVRLDGLRRAICSPIVSSIGMYSLVHAIVVSQDRYHLAFAAQIAMLAGTGLSRLATKSTTLPNVKPQTGVDQLAMGHPTALRRWLRIRSSFDTFRQHKSTCNVKHQDRD